MTYGKGVKWNKRVIVTKRSERHIETHTDRERHKETERVRDRERQRARD